MKTKTLAIIALLCLTLIFAACTKPVETTPVTQTTPVEKPVVQDTSTVVNVVNNNVDKTSGVTDKNGCYDSEGGKFYDKAGYITDVKGVRFDDICTSDTSLTEYYCGQLGYKEDEIYKCAVGCKAGACLKGTAAKECTDTDFKDYYKKGAVTYKGVTTEDFCKDTKTLAEQYCTNVDVASQEEKFCTNGCSNGACAQVTATDSKAGCTDPDLGSGQEFTKSTVTDPNGAITDSCLNSNTVKEWKCNSVGFRTSTNIACANGCTDGACVK